VGVARLLFLRAVQREANAVLKDLKEQVLPSWSGPFQPPTEANRLRPAPARHSVRALWEVGELSRSRTSAGADEALSAWTARWNLSAPWMIDAGWETCVFWLKHPETLRMGSPEWSPETMARLKPVPAEDRVLEGWDPSLEQEQAFRQRVEQHIERVKDYAAGQGWRAALEDTTGWRFDWLVWHQVIGLSWNEISLKDPGSPAREAVRASVLRTAELIDLPIRDSQED